MAQGLEGEITGEATRWAKVDASGLLTAMCASTQAARAAQSSLSTTFRSAILQLSSYYCTQQD